MNHFFNHRLTAWILTLLTVSSLYAQERPVIKIDFNEPSRKDLEVLENGYTPWKVPKDCLRDSLTVDGVTFIIAAESNMRGGWKKEFVQTAVDNVKLIGDGLSFENKENDGYIRLMIVGLPAGTHSIKTFHNSWQDPALACGWPIYISCNGMPVDTVHRTFQQTVAEAAACMNTSFEVISKTDTTVFEFRTDMNDDPADFDGKSKFDVAPLINAFDINAENVKVIWPMMGNMANLNPDSIDEAAADTSANISDGNIPAPFLFLTGISENRTSFSIEPRLGISFLPKSLKMTLGFVEPGDDYAVVSIRSGEQAYIIDTVRAQASGSFKRQEMSWPLYRFTTSYLTETIFVNVDIHSEKDGLRCLLGNVEISGDRTEADQPIYLATTKVSPDEKYGQVIPSSIYFIQGQTVTFEAAANEKYGFREWQNDGRTISTENPLTTSGFIGDTLLVAIFETAQRYTLTYGIEGGEGCRVRVNPEGEIRDGKMSYQDGDRVTLTAYPGEDLYFSHWMCNGDELSKSNPLTVKMDQNRDIKAIFTTDEVMPLLAFPTAEGYGRYATGGRGGYVVEVTNLSSDANIQGSLPWALKQHSGKPITVVFRVSGTIECDEKYLTLGRSNVTYAGQTAPGEGICIRKTKVKLNGNNVIMRNIRFRVGDELGLSLSALGCENFKNVIIDHCDFSWSTEENVTMYDNDSTTMQWCILSEPLYNSNNYKGARSYGAQWGGEYASYHHNLLAHCVSRAPRFNGSSNNDYHAYVDVRNCVMYNCGNSYGGEIRNGGVSCWNQLVNNYYKLGPASGDKFVSPSSPYGDWYITGNYMENNAAANANNWKAVNTSVEEQIRRDQPYDDFPIFTETAEEAYQSVLAGVGVWPRDTVDRRLIAEAAGLQRPKVVTTYGKAGIIDTPSDVEGWPSYQSDAVAPADSDHDGMPDEWESANGLNPNDPEDRNKVTKSGYTALEVYLNSLMGESIRLIFDNPTDALTNPSIEVSCYLNPETHILYVNTCGKVADLSVFSLDGKHLLCTSEAQADLSNIASGICLVRVRLEDGTSSQAKIVR